MLKMLLILVNATRSNAGWQLTLRRNQTKDFWAEFFGGLGEVVLGLHADPEFGGRAEGVGEAECHFGGDAGTTV